MIFVLPPTRQDLTHGHFIVMVKEGGIIHVPKLVLCWKMLVIGPQGGIWTKLAFAKSPGMYTRWPKALCLSLILHPLEIIRVCNFLKIFIIQRVKALTIPCLPQPPIRSNNAVSVAQGGTATPGATKQLLPPDRVFKGIIYIYIYIC